MVSSLIAMGARSARYCLLAIAGLLIGIAAHAQTALLDEVTTVATPDVAVPVQHAFTISAAGEYQLTLVDLGAAIGSPTDSVKLAITRGSTIVGTPLTAPGTLQFTATANTEYVVRIIGKPNSALGSGLLGVQVAAAGGATVNSFSATLAPTSPLAQAGSGAVQETFTVDATDDYIIKVTDLQLPQGLNTLALLLIEDGGFAPLAILDETTTQATVHLSTGVSYRVFAVGAADSGLYSVTVATAGGVSPFNRVVRLGAVSLLGTVTLDPGAYELSLADLVFPAALGTVGVALVRDGANAVAPIIATGMQPVTVATRGNYLVYTYGVAAGASGGGSYAVELKPQAGGAAVFSSAQAVSEPGSGISAYTYNANVATAGAHTARLVDFQVPAAFTSINLAVVQGAAVLGSPLNGAGSREVTANPGPVSIFAFSKAASGGSIFGLDFAQNGASAPLFETTQGDGAGRLFAVRKVAIAAAGSYDVRVRDVAFPAAFPDLVVAVTRGVTREGFAFGGGKVTFAATPGNYLLNIIALPAAADKAGTYALTAVPSPPAPVVTFASNVDHVVSGGTVTITWSSQGAASCKSTGPGFEVTSQQLSGSFTTPAITANSTFTMSCTGDGGTTDKSLTIVADEPVKKGGGGSLDIVALFGLAALLAWRLRRAAGAMLAVLVAVVSFQPAVLRAQEAKATEEAAGEADAPFDVMEFRVLGNTTMPATTIERTVYPFLGPGKRVADVESARVALERAYHDSGYGTVFVDIPEQQIDQGVVRLHVTEGRLDRVRITGARYFSNGKIRAALPAATRGDVPRLPDLQTQLASVNRATRDRSVVPVLKAGRAPGTVDLEFRVTDSLPLHGALDMNDRYSADTTRLRLNASLSYDNLFQRQHSLSLQYQTAPTERDEYQAIVGTYSFRLPSWSNTSFAVYAVDSKTSVATISSLGGPLSVLGNGNIYGLRAIHSLYETSKYSNTFVFGVDYKDFLENIQQPDTDGLLTPIRYMSWSASYSGAVRAERSVTAFNVGTNFGIRGLVNDSLEFEDKRFKGAANYFYLRAGGQHLHQLPLDLAAFGRIAGQFSATPLVSNEQLAMGGADTVRGYTESAVLGDYGFNATFELRSNSLAKLLRMPAGGTYFLLFYDAGVVAIVEPLPKQRYKSDLASAGAGLRISNWQGFSLALDWAHALADAGTVLAGDERLHFSFRYDF